VNISEEEAGKLVGHDTIEKLRQLTLRLYSRGAAHAEHRGIIVADTKFEFGRLTQGPHQGDIILIDEALTPDSSRFWPRDLYMPGGPQPSFDKQFVRDFLESIRWNKQPPVPTLPDDVIAKTREKYVQAFQLLSGLELE
jgi:phosphoribosylaminoimidazole-succinocarboxamide synthase